MKGNKNPVATADQDLRDFFLAMQTKNTLFLQAIRMSTASKELQQRIDREIGRKQNENCQAEVIALRY